VPPPRLDRLLHIGVNWPVFMTQGVLFVVLGTLAVALPVLASLEIELLLGWLFIVGGCVRAATIFGQRIAPGRWWSFLSGLVAIAFGAILVSHPLQGTESLTLLLTLWFGLEGLAAILVALEYRKHQQIWFWTLASGAVNVLLAALIWQHWPNGATWLLGLYVGINMIFVGWPLILAAVVARRGALAGSQ
jgi:uncharacterized membrane protein HdeD (DUF308 family)